ncbi:MAG: type II toxin-antitoxin system HicB family antitoxin [Cyclobacteriaceae bacterium]
MKQYLVIIEQEDNSFGAYVPDLPACVAVGESRDEVSELIKEAIHLHLESMKEDGEMIPDPKSTPLHILIE